MRKETWLANVFHRYLRVPYTLNVKVYQNPKHPRATFVFIHGIGNSLHAWNEIVDTLPDDVRLIGIDLLGFGDSPKPRHAVYNAKTQARSVGVTLLSLRLAQRPILIGHSLGALVAVDIASRYPLVIKRLVLCSPPFYRPRVPAATLPTKEEMLRSLYKAALKHPDQLQKLSPIAVRLGLANKALTINEDTTASYIAALESSIINQTSLSEIKRLSLPITIMYGALDPVVVSATIAQLGKSQKNITVKRIVAGHEVVGRYAKELTKLLSSLLSRTNGL